LFQQIATTETDSVGVTDNTVDRIPKNVAHLVNSTGLLKVSALLLVVVVGLVLMVVGKVKHFSVVHIFTTK
jgi:hypothetical protein